MTVSGDHSHGRVNRPQLAVERSNMGVSTGLIALLSMESCDLDGEHVVLNGDLTMTWAKRVQDFVQLVS